LGWAERAQQMDVVLVRTETLDLDLVTLLDLDLVTLLDLDLVTLLDLLAETQEFGHYFRAQQGAPVLDGKDKVVVNLIGTVMSFLRPTSRDGYALGRHAPQYGPATLVGATATRSGNGSIPDTRRRSVHSCVAT
jgi:hypothetical protein